VHRFYAHDLDPAQSIVVLPADEAQHLTRVLRLTPGALVAVFDGKGKEYSARVQSARREHVRLQILEPRQPARESTLAITLAQAVLKGDKMDDVVRDAVMLGVADIRPVVSARTETSRAAMKKAKRAQRWRRIAVASAKQCGRAVVPPVEEPVALAELVRSAPSAAMKLALVEPSQPRGESVAMLNANPRPRAAIMVIGPEGGWKPDELDQLSGGSFRLVTLGSRTLRAEAVPLAVLALLQFIWGDL
jgi:16S rRNA (uracil1498-N3)-methyltransferase